MTSRVTYKLHIGWMDGIKMGKLPGARLGMPIGNQVNSSMVGWFSRNRARDSSIKDVAPDWSDNFSFLRRGKLHFARL